jgi:hypothetical protein
LVPIWLSKPSTVSVWGGHDAGVVDQHVGLVRPVGELAHRRQVLQVEPTHLHVTGHLLRGGLALGRVADGHDDLGALARQFAGRHRAQPAVGAGDDHGAPGERRQICGGPFSHG